jgi:hypothetical protein
MHLVGRIQRIYDGVDGIQRIYDSGWDPSAQSDDSRSEQVKRCMDLKHCVSFLHLEPAHLLRDRLHSCFPTGSPTGETNALQTWYIWCMSIVYEYRVSMVIRAASPHLLAQDVLPGRSNGG